MRSLLLLLLAAAPTWKPALQQEGITDTRLLAAFEKVRRADFLPEEQKPHEMEDHPLAIGYDQTTSQPTLIARLIQTLELKPGCRVLEVGTGSGYQTALLGELCAEVYSVEIVAPLAERAGKVLDKLGYKNAHVRAGDGYLGWPDKAPFDGVVVGAGAAKVPQPLIDQLKPGAKLVIPVGEREDMSLLVVTKNKDGSSTTQKTIPVRFVPLTGEHADKDRGSKR